MVLVDYIIRQVSAKSCETGCSIKAACVIITIVLAKEEENPAFVVFAVKTLINALVQTTDPPQIEALAGALQAVPGKLPPTEAQQIFAHLTDAFAYTPNGFQLDVLAGVLKAVPIQLDRQQLINFLKWPSSVGVVRSTFLDMLEQQTGQKFGQFQVPDDSSLKLCSFPLMVDVV